MTKMMQSILLLSALVAGVGCANSGSGRTASEWIVPGSSTYYHYQDVQEEQAAMQAAVIVRPSEVGGRVDVAIDPVSFFQAVSADPWGFAFSATKDTAKGAVWAFLGKKAYDEWGSNDRPHPPAVDLNGSNLRLNVFEDGSIPPGGFRVTGEDIQVNFGEARPEPETPTEP